MKVRVSLTLDEDLIATYKNFAWESKQSFSSLINEWLETTAPAMKHLHAQVLELKNSPEKVLNDLILFQEQTADQVAQMNEVLQKLQSQNEARTARSDAPHCPEPNEGDAGKNGPCSNTGLNLPSPLTNRGVKLPNCTEKGRK